MKSIKKVCVLFSGGVDALVLMYLLQSQGVKVTAIEIDYFGRPKMERQACDDIVEFCKFDRVRITLLSNMNTLKPLSYLSLVGLAQPWCSQLQADAIAIGLIYDDRHNSADPQVTSYSISSLDRLLRLSSEGKMGLITPLVGFNKQQILTIGTSLGAPLNLAV